MNEAVTDTKVWIPLRGGKWRIALDIWNSTWYHSLDSLWMGREHKEQLLPAFRGSSVLLVCAVGIFLETQKDDNS